ncbi:MAG: ankyrin repeat domain-containing protein [Tatlockia sp.]|nr:ankyrin repeat domain-containing protein [Tatlockia sp.]
MYAKIENESKLYQKFRNTKIQEYKNIIECLKIDLPNYKSESNEEIYCKIDSQLDEEKFRRYIESTLHETYSNLVRSEFKMFSKKLNKFPEYLKLRDKKGWTLLHHLAHESNNLYANDFKNKLFLLGEKGIDFNVKANCGDTATHIITLRCTFQKTNLTHFPLFISVATQKGFNFNIRGQLGLTVLQIASSLRYKNFQFFNPISNVQTLLESIPNLDLDPMSASGGTALFFAIQSGNLSEAKILLNAGADPFVYDNPELKPLALIERCLADNKYESTTFELNDLKQIILAMIEEAIPQPNSPTDVSFNF